MIQAFIGESQARKKARDQALLKGGYDIGKKIEGDALTASALEELLGKQDLFGGKSAFIIDGPTHSKSSWEIVKEKLPHMKASQNLFVIEGDTLTLAEQKLLEKHGEVVVFKAPPQKKKEAPKAFKLTDAVLKKDKKMMWVTYRDALSAGEAPEALHGALLWQLKNLILVHEHPTQNESGLSPFVFSKTQKALPFFPKDKTTRYMHELTVLYHESRERGEDLGERLESWLLEFS